jgi:hypothetical protein
MHTQAPSQNDCWGKAGPHIVQFAARQFIASLQQHVHCCLPVLQSHKLFVGLNWKRIWQVFKQMSPGRTHQKHYAHSIIACSTETQCGTMRRRHKSQVAKEVVTTGESRTCLGLLQLLHALWGIADGVDVPQEPDCVTKSDASPPLLLQAPRLRPKPSPGLFQAHPQLLHLQLASCKGAWMGFYIWIIDQAFCLNSCFSF